MAVSENEKNSKSKQRMGILKRGRRSKKNGVFKRKMGKRLE